MGLESRSGRVKRKDNGREGREGADSTAPPARPVVEEGNVFLGAAELRYKTKRTVFKRI